MIVEGGKNCTLRPQTFTHRVSVEIKMKVTLWGQPRPLNEDTILCFEFAQIFH